MSSLPRVAIALGSSLGDRDGHLDFALSRLAPLLTELRVSSRYNTDPVDVVGEQSPFLNAALVARTHLSPHDLLRALQQIEEARGRERPYPNAPRTLDLDIILYGDLVLSDGTLDVPHPRYRTRGFVLEPLAEIAPELTDPVTGQSMRELVARARLQRS